MSYGASGDRLLKVPGEELQGVHSARAFVNWYNGHPDFAAMHFDLSHETAVVVGQGNVAIDVARILCSPLEALRSTDIANYAWDALSRSRVRKVYLVGRRGPVQSAFTIKEFREISVLPGVTTVMEEEELKLSRSCQQELNDSRPVKRKYELMMEVHNRSRALSASEIAAGKEIHFKFFSVPSAIAPAPWNQGHVGSIVFEKTTLQGAAGKQSAVSTGETFEFPTGLVLRSIGYQSTSLEGAPFDVRAAVIPNINGRVVPVELAKAKAAQKSLSEEEKNDHSGLYVSGWLKRGPNGIIATNIVDAKETVAEMVDDYNRGRLNAQVGAIALTSMSCGSINSL